MGEQEVAGFYGGVAQLGEHLPCKQGVMSSNLTISMSKAPSRGSLRRCGGWMLASKTTQIIKRTAASILRADVDEINRLRFMNHLCESDLRIRHCAEKFVP